jgi:hypothetical protein
MDLASIKHLAHNLPSFPLAPLKYTPTPTEVLKAEIVKHIAQADGPDDNESEVWALCPVYCGVVCPNDV